jgi:tRNA-specific 2-thiouridylase
MSRVKALALFSGGLDSILAVKLLLAQGIDIEGINFSGFFCSCKQEGTAAIHAAKALGVPLKVVCVKNDYLRMVRNPKHGYGRHMNPCVDCKIYMIKAAKKYAEKIRASFIFTGEVLDERPMSQHLKALKIIEEESGLNGRLLRPLSAKLLPETMAEKKGLIDRTKLMAIRGRSRKPQLRLAKEFGIQSFPSPAGGCLLTEKEFASKLQDLFQHKQRCSIDDVALLKLGRHFRLGRSKIIVGRNEAENKTLSAEKARKDYYFEAPAISGPITVLQGLKTKKAIATAAALTAFYSDSKSEKVLVNYGKENLDKTITVLVPNRAQVDSLRIK